MKYHLRRLLAGLVAATVAFGLFGSGSAVAAAAGTDPVERVRQALGANVVVRETESGPGWKRIQLARSDDPYPVVVDVLASVDPNRRPSRTAYLLPGGGLNFEANFFTPRADNVAHFLRRGGYLVIGVTPREDSMKPLANDEAALGWDLAAHRRDVAAIAGAVNAAVRLPHDVLGHSAGAAVALSYAGTTPAGLGRAMILDTTGPYDPVSEPKLRENAEKSRGIVAGLLPAIRAVDTANARKTLLRNAAANPNGDSGQPRPAGGTFTYAGALHFQLIRTADVPGSLFNWIYEPSVHAGTYAYGPQPAQDTFALTHTTVPLVAEATDNLTSGMLPTVLLRDLFALWSGAPGLVDWAGIKAEVAWVNMELGRGNHPYGANLITASGNAKVRFTVVRDYGHGDPAWGVHANRDVWPLLVL